MIANAPFLLERLDIGRFIQEDRALALCEKLLAPNLKILMYNLRFSGGFFDKLPRAHLRHLNCNCFSTVNPPPQAFTNILEASPNLNLISLSMNSFKYRTSFLILEPFNSRLASSYCRILTLNLQCIILLPKTVYHTWVRKSFFLSTNGSLRRLRGRLASHPFHDFRISGLSSRFSPLRKLTIWNLNTADEYFLWTHSPFERLILRHRKITEELLLDLSPSENAIIRTGPNL